MATATLVKDNLEEFRGHAALWHVSPPVKSGYGWTDEEKRVEYDYVVVSSIDARQGDYGEYFPAETYVFGANELAETINYHEIEGSRKGTWSHSEILEAMGFDVVI